MKSSSCNYHTWWSYITNITMSKKTSDKSPYLFLLTKPVTSETLPVFPTLCTQWTLNNHRYSVRQCVWRLGQETNLSEVPKVQRGDIAKLKDTGQVSCTWGNPKPLTEASQKLPDPWTCSQVLPRPQREVHRKHISLKKGESSGQLWLLPSHFCCSKKTN